MRPELQDVVDDVATLLGRPVTLEDRAFHLVAFCSHGTEIDEVRQHSILQRRSTAQVRAWFERFGIATAEEPVRTPAAPDEGVLSRWCLPARWNGVTYGYLWLIDDEQAVDATRLPEAMVLAERAGALMAQQARARIDVGHKVDDLLSTNAETAEQAAAEIDELGLVRRGVPVAAVELSLVGPRTPAPGALNVWTLPRSVLTAPGDDHTTMIVPVPGSADVAVQVARRAWDLYAERLAPADRGRLVAGIGTPRADLASVRESWKEARLATRVIAAVPQLGPVGAWSELGLYRLLACGPQSALAGAVLDPAVRRLLDSDDPDLRETARVWLDCAGSVQRTAAELSVHRQTVYHRLDRVQRLTGLDLDRGDQRLLLHLGLLLAPLLRPDRPERAV